MASSSSVSVEATSPQWVELPQEITAAILLRLGTKEILKTAQRVCTAWRSVCQDPAMWRSINLRYKGDIWDMPYNIEKMYNVEKICRHALDLSQGQVTDTSIEFFGTNELLRYMAQRCSKLRRLRLGFTYGITSEGLIEAIQNFPLLEEVHLFYTFTDLKTVETVGRSCPLLKSFIFNNSWHKEPQVECDLEALAIAKNMPELRHLQLLGNTMTNEGFQAILDGCPHLEFVDLRQCYNVDLSGDLGKLCSQRIKDLRPPNDSMDDYEFNAEVYQCETSDDDYITGFSDMDMVSDYDDYLEFSGGSDASDEDEGEDELPY